MRRNKRALRAGVPGEQKEEQRAGQREGVRALDSGGEGGEGGEERAGTEDEDRGVGSGGDDESHNGSLGTVPERGLSSAATPSSRMSGVGGGGGSCASLG